MSVLLYEQVAGEIEQHIRNQDLPAGSRLSSERKLAEQFHVSRNVVRQALSLLEERHLLEREAGNGYLVSVQYDKIFISSLRKMLFSSKTTFLDALEVRQVLELAIVERCIPYVTDEKVKKLTEIWKQMEALKEQKKVGQFLQLDEKFHKTIAMFLPNQVFQMMLSTVFSLPVSFFDLSPTLETVLEDTQTEHLAIIKGLLHRNVEEAKAAMLFQMDNIRGNLEITCAQHTSE